MNFYSLQQVKATEKQDMEQDYKAGRAIGIVRLGKEHLYFRRIRKIYYVPYTDIRRCFRRVMRVPAKLCCGRGDLEVENLVICTDQGKWHNFRCRVQKRERFFWKNSKIVCRI